MTEAEFVHAVTPFSRLSAKAVAVAKAVLVDGQTVETVAAVNHGASRQLVYKWATQVYESFRPEGWITKPITLPPDLMTLVHEMEIDARGAWAAALPPPKTVRR